MAQIPVLEVGLTPEMEKNEGGHKPNWNNIRNDESTGSVNVVDVMLNQNIDVKNDMLEDK